MTENFLTKVIDNISFFRLAGIKKYIILDIYRDNAELKYVQIKEPFYRINKSKLIESFDIIHSENIQFGNDLSVITNYLKNLIEKNNLEEAYLIVGINDFRFKTVKLPKDSEDNKFWFDDNTDKFLPEGRVSDDFIFSYQKYFEDEDNEYFNIVIARRNYIESITKTCQVNNIKIVTISPFPLQIHSLEFAKSKNLLFLNVREDKIIYTYSDNKNNFLSAETFLSSGNASSNESEIDNITLNQVFYEIKQNIDAFQNNLETDFNIFATSTNLNQSSNISIIKSVFQTEFVNSEPFNNHLQNLTSAIVLNNLFTGQDDSINLLPTETKSENVEQLEKKTSLRVVLSLGIVIIFMLLFTYIGENIISSTIASNESKLIEIDSKTKMLDNYEKENVKVLSNLSKLNILKGKRVIYSTILNSLIDGSNNKSCFTNLTVNEAKTGFEIKIEGLAYTQPDVTAIIKNMEQLENFTNVYLEYANSVERSKFKNKVWLPSKSMINFSFSARYYEN